MICKWGSAAMAVTMLASLSGAMAADQTSAPQKVQHAALQPGKAAGVHKAEWFYWNGSWIWFSGAAVILAGAILTASGGAHHSTPVTTTTANP